MRKLVTGLALVAAVLWSAVVWGGYALIGWGGELLAGNLGLLVQPPELMELAAWARVLAESFGQGAAIVLWLLGLGLIGIALLAVNLVLGRLAPAPRPAVPPPLPQAAPPVQPQPTPPAAPAWGRQASGR